ncbi:hypothetical protein RJ639_043084, partial [Escallonia herrerae]
MTEATIPDSFYNHSPFFKRRWRGRRVCQQQWWRLWWGMHHRGRRRHRQVPNSSVPRHEKDDVMDEEFDGTPSTKFTSKRYLETPTSGNGKAGMYVYECKTCYRTFPSFQALGRHRASHKKPKKMAGEKKRSPSPPPLVSDDEDFSFKKHNQTNTSSPLSLPLTPKSSKVHECSICGAEFTSGQALGGHMRRHRMSGGTSKALSLSPNSFTPTVIESEEGKNTGNVLSLELDLNLPAPEHDHLRDTKFAFTSKQQQQHQQQQKQQYGLDGIQILLDDLDAYNICTCNILESRIALVYVDHCGGILDEAEEVLALLSSQEGQGVDNNQHYDGVNGVEVGDESEGCMELGVIYSWANRDRLYIGVDNVEDGSDSGSDFHNIDYSSDDENDDAMYKENNDPSVL